MTLPKDRTDRWVERKIGHPPLRNEDGDYLLTGDEFAKLLTIDWRCGAMYFGACFIAAAALSAALKHWLG